MVKIVFAVALVAALASMAQARTAEECAADLQVLNDAMYVATPQGDELPLECNMTYNPCEPGSEFRYRDPEERIANFGAVEITCGTRQLLECDANGCLTQITMADVGLQVNGTMELMAPFPSLKVLDIDGYCEFGASVGGICVSEFNGTIDNFVKGVDPALMEYFSMRGTYLEGDATALSALTNLQHLDLYGNMEMTGVMDAALSGMKGMEYLNLMSTCTEMTTQTVGSLNEMIFLNLHGWGASEPRKGCPRVEGPLSEISNLKKLQYLDAVNWVSSGQLSDLGGLTALQALYLANFDNTFEVTGSLSDLSALSELETLLLSKLDVEISMDDLTMFPNLQSLTVVEPTNVMGDASSVCDLPTLTKLQLVGSDMASCDDLNPCLETCQIIS